MNKTDYMFRIVALAVLWSALAYLSYDGFLFMPTASLEFTLSILFLLAGIVLTFVIWCGPELVNTCRSEHGLQNTKKPADNHADSSTMKGSMKTFVKLLAIIGATLVVLFIIMSMVGKMISKPLLVESKEAIAAYSGDGEATYLRAPAFGIDGVAIEMPAFNMMDGLHTDYSLSGIPLGNPYSIALVVPLGVERDEALVNTIFQGNWKYSIKCNGQVVKEFSDSLGNIHVSGYIGGEYVYIGDELQFSFFSLEENKQHDHHLKVDGSADSWSISVTFTNEVLEEPIHAYIYLRRGGSA